MEKKEIAHKVTHKEMIEKAKEKGLSTSLARKLLKDVNWNIDKINDAIESRRKNLIDIANGIKDNIRRSFINAISRDLKEDFKEKDIRNLLTETFRNLRRTRKTSSTGTVKTMKMLIKDNSLNSSKTSKEYNELFLGINTGFLAGTVMIEEMYKDIESNKEQIIKDIMAKRSYVDKK